ncbi:hypothetical protein [Flavobacterium acetivorans]|uniref:hypothetical protein n=1 Tax=Flavobacterium acetivorans TaxID=2893883 RepID=UPI001E59E90D|nr:hypothetical protein [Flavobacterium sp. F-29]UFH35700.1 hypothetical protein LNP19_01335 [Flavobacterium sp. F-29]
MIKIYTATEFITEGNRRIIFPLLFDLCYILNPNLSKIYELTTHLESSDVVIVPVDIAYFFKNNKQNWLFEFIDNANEQKKKVWVYSAGDFGITLKKNIYTFRLGGFASKINEQTFIMPAYALDPYTLLSNEFKPLAKPKLPKIGFVGHATHSFMGLLKEYLIYLNLNCKRIFKLDYFDLQCFYPIGYKRYQFLKQLQENKLIECDFIFRKKHRAGAKTAQRLKETTLEFFTNMYHCPYTFCLRGAGNFSVRFYETLAMGRIPLVINTDIQLPLEDFISWDKHCVLANEDNFMEVLINFHQNISNEDFERIQLNNRNLWEATLHREAYFKSIHAIFKN